MKELENNKNALLCASFPGTGKTTLYNKYNGTEVIIIDSDSSKFNKSKFPENYIHHIKDSINKADIICISSHKEVRDALVANDLYFTLIYPHRSLKKEYIARYKDRGNSHLFIELVEKNWDIWITECENQLGCIHIVLPSMIFINDVINPN